MRYINISGYRFTDLDHLPVLQADLFSGLDTIGVKGTVLLADEGINVALTGTAEQITAVRELLQGDARFADLWLKESRSESIPFSKLKVRIRHEIIAFDGPRSNTRRKARPSAPSMTPEKLDDWIQEERDFILLDTRNDYEIESGGFPNATHLDLKHFRDFQDAIDEALENGKLRTDKPIVTFCTGGIRCEKAGPWMRERGFEEVYQVEGGVLNYFERTGGKHWEGDCFVFDDRVEIDKQMQPTGASFCEACQLTIPPDRTCDCQSSNTAIDTV